MEPIAEIEIMTPKINKFQNIWSKSPMIMRENRICGIECPKCKDTLEIRYNINGGNFICPSCGFVLA
jgi:hypothetical protein